MFLLHEFRAGQYGIPFGFSDDLPECCFRCPYLMAEENPVCYCDQPFYYYCVYSWPDRLTTDTPPCLAETAPA